MSMIRCCLLMVLFAGCSALPRGTEDFSEAESQRLFQRFEKLRPPFDSVAAFQVLGDSEWVRHTTFYDPDFTSGFWPLPEMFGNGGNPTVATLRAGTHTKAGWSIYLHFHSAITAAWAKKNSRHDTPLPAGWTPPFAEGHAQSFFQGRTPSDVQVDEYTLCYPDGHLLNVTSTVRKTIPSNTYHL